MVITLRWDDHAMAQYGRNINVKKYSSIKEIYDSVNNDPKRPGFQIVYLDRASNSKLRYQWVRYLETNGFPDLTVKQPAVEGVTYTAIIIKATPEQATALKICF